jgi:serine 3-dehydrogenase
MIVFISGASSGIGAATARAFALSKAKLILAARRMDRLRAIEGELPTDCHLIELDVRDRAAVHAAVDAIPPPFAEIDVLVNNAGLSRGLSPLHEGSEDDWDEMIDTNVKGLLYVTRAFLPHLVAQNRGDVINIGSQAGHMVYPKGNVYAASKFAVKAITHGGNVDLVGTRVRMSTVDPGMTHTEFSEVRFHGDKERSDAFYRGYTPLSGADIAEAVVWVVERPPHVHVRDVVLMPIVQRNMMVFEDRKK